MIDRTREKEVWSRVMAASAEAPAPAARCAPAAKAAPQARESGLTENQVQTLLSQKAADAATYRAMASRAPGSQRRTLEQLAMEKRDQSRQLAAVYYVMTGRKPQTEPQKAANLACTPETLRARYQAETADAARYDSLAEQSGPFAGAFRDLGHAGERHAQMLLKLLQGWMP